MRKKIELAHAKKAPELKCETCLWFTDKNQAWEGGTCRINPPYIRKPSKDTQFFDKTGHWPQVRKDDFCGEHKARES